MDKKICNRLRTLRYLSGLSQEDLAEELNVSRSKVSSWESGRRDLSIVDAIQIANYFKCSLDNLFNPGVLSKEEYIKISKRFFESKEIEYKDKEQAILKIRGIFLNSNAEEIIPLTQNDSN